MDKLLLQSGLEYLGHHYQKLPLKMPRNMSNVEMQLHVKQQGIVIHQNLHLIRRLLFSENRDASLPDHILLKKMRFI